MPSSPPFHGNRVIRCAFVLALFGWGIGFYGPPVFLHAVMARTGWSPALVSAAVTLHVLWGAGVVACLPHIHRRLGIPATTTTGAVLLAAGAMGWALAEAPWQLFAAAMLTGGGWVPLGAAGINAQADFAPADVPRVVARSVALSQALYAFAPAVLAGLLLGAAHTTPALGASTDAYFCAIFLLQVLAAVCVLGARRPKHRLRPAQ